MGSKFAASSSTSLVSSPTSDSRPPMIAASATARSPSAIKRSLGARIRSVPSSVRSVSPATRAANDDPATRELRAVEDVQRAPPHVHHVVRDVDHVRDRPHAGEMQPAAEPLRRRRDRDVPEDARDVAGAAAEVLDPNVHVFGARGRVFRRERA